jgi:hypothetical protein
MLTIKLFDSSKLTWKIKYNNENTTAGTSSGYEQAQGHELCAQKPKNKQIDSSEFK